MDPEKKLQEELETKVGENPEPKLDADGNPIEAPAWMQEDDDNGTSSDETVVPLAAHLRFKKKAKGQLSEKEEENERLRQENEQLRQQQQQQTFKPEGVPKRPRRADFDDEDEYEAAMDEYEEKRFNYATQFAVKNTQQTQQLEKTQRQQEEAVNSHYDRASKLVTEHGISPEVFQKTDERVKEIIDSVMPGRGESVFDHMVSLVGEGSEKTMFYVGRNKAAQAEFQTLLQQDPTGLKASLYLGRITERISGSKTSTSQAPAPGPTLKGDTKSGQGSAEYRKWQDAHKKGNAQLAFDIKKAARKAGIDTRDWR